MTTPAAMARQQIGRALGAEPGECVCALCGPSPFGVGRPAKAVMGPSFTDYDALLAPDSPVVCDGCNRMTAGRPGSDPPPLRMSSFAVVGGELLRLGMDEMRALLEGAYDAVEVVGWAISRQKHASLRCLPCSPSLYLIGCDDGVVEWRPAEDAPLLSAVETLRTVARREQVLSGAYPPHVIARLGQAWGPAEEVVARYRPSLTLSLAVSMVRRPDLTEESPPMQIPPEYRDAASVLLPLALRSRLRTADPITFWSTTLPRRLAAARSCTSLMEWVGYLVDALRVDAYHPEVVAVLALDVDEDAVMGVVRKDHRLLITHTRALMAEQRATDTDAPTPDTGTTFTMELRR